MSGPQIQDAYDTWAEQYDDDENATRDLNAAVLREEGFVHADDDILEIGCGTGFNTQWLFEKADRLWRRIFPRECWKRHGRGFRERM